MNQDNAAQDNTAQNNAAPDNRFSKTFDKVDQAARGKNLAAFALNFRIAQIETGLAAVLYTDLTAEWMFDCFAKDVASIQPACFKQDYPDAAAAVDEFVTAFNSNVDDNVRKAFKVIRAALNPISPLLASTKSTWFTNAGHQWHRKIAAGVVDKGCANVVVAE